MTSSPADRTVKVLRKQRFYPHPIEVVWAALTNADALAQWLMPNNFVAEAGREFEFRVDSMGPIGGVAKCRVLELEPPDDPGATRARMVWSWTQMPPSASSGPPRREMRIEWSLEAHEGGTRLSFTQSGLELLPWLYRKMMTFGWGTMLKRWLPVVCKQFEQTPDGWRYRRMDKPPNRGHHKTTTVPAHFAK